MKKLFLVCAAICGLFAPGCPNPGKSSPITVDFTVEFTGLAANGSPTETTATLSLTFDKDIPGLSASDITLNNGNTGASVQTLTQTGTGTYELALSGISQGGTVTVSVYKSGCIISGGPRQVTVFYYNDGNGENIAAAFTGLAANGSNTETTATLTLAFDQDIPGLDAWDITLNAGSTGAVQGPLNRTGTGVYELTVYDIRQNGTVTVSVNKDGYDISGSPKTVTVYYYDPFMVTFTNLTADGSAASATTSKLTLTFDKDIAGLAAADISLNAGSTGAVKGTLTKTGTGVYELSLSGITQGGTVSVSASKSGYVIAGGPKTAPVYWSGGSAGFSITFTQLTDSAPSITGPTLYRVSNNGPTSAALSVDNPGQYTSVTWRVQDTGVTANGPTFTLSADNAAYNFIGEHFVSVSVVKGGAPYNKTVSFKVEY
jgi:hypothetical protein